MKQNQTNSRSALGLVVAGALLRLMPHPPNVAPVGAMSLFSGARITGWPAYVVPLLIMLVTDPIIGAMQGFQPFSSRTPVIYASFLVSVWIGRHLHSTENVLKIGGAAFLCALQFYLITNFWVWVRNPIEYAHTPAGLIACYIAALPFFGMTLIGNLAYTGLFFGAHAWLTRRNASAETAGSLE